MGERLSNALKALGAGLTTIAAYRGAQEEKEGERAFQREMRDGQQAFQTRMMELQQAQAEKMMDKGQEFNAADREDKQLFDMELFNKKTAIEERHFAQEMAARWAQIRASAANAGGGSNAAGERQLTRQLGVYELQVKTAAGEYEGVQKAMNEEVKALADDKMLALRPEQMKAARKEIMDRYQPQLADAKTKINEGMSLYSEAVGIKAKPDFSNVQSGSKEPEARRPAGDAPSPMAGGMAATASAINEDRVTQAVRAARSQLGSSLTPATMPSELNLVAGFEKAGLTRAEAVKAARQLQRQASGDRFTKGR